MAKPLEFTPAIHARILKCIKENIILPIGRNNESLNPEWGIPFQTVPIYKDNDVFDQQNYRPISLVTLKFQ